jgi:hypothetical protein
MERLRAAQERELKKLEAKKEKEKKVCVGCVCVWGGGLVGGLRPLSHI